MQTYTAKTLLYLRDPVQDTDPETGAPIERERGYIHPGETFRLPDDDPRIETWLSIGAIEKTKKAAPPAPKE